MYPHYYARRRVNPYKGVLQVVDIGEATAHSHDGLRWYLRADDGYGLVRPVGVWQAGEGLLAGRPDAAADLVQALESRPPLPFQLIDTWELWLLQARTGLPLALLDTVGDAETRLNPVDLQWHAFVQKYQGFHSPSLAREGEDVDGDHVALLNRMINRLAGPKPMAQWFLRDRDGAGRGAEGPGLAQAMYGRFLPAGDFPELLLREEPNSRLEQSVIADYHAALAPLLLLLPHLHASTRECLEVQACSKPRWLARIYRLLPQVLDPARLNAALVAARLEQAQDQTLDDWIEN